MNDYKNIIKNTEKACALCEKPFSHEEIINIIKGNNDLEKQICILRLEEIHSEQEAHLLIDNLTNQHGIIREAIAFKINEFMQNKNFNTFFQSKKAMDIILDAVIDMNPNICRQIIEILPFIIDKEYIFTSLYSRTMSVINEAKTMNRRNRGYIYSKKIFKLFWYMESIAVLGYFSNTGAIKEIIEQTCHFEDYTIREKCAKIIAHSGREIELSKYKNILLNDENFFVRRMLMPSQAFC